MGCHLETITYAWENEVVLSLMARCLVVRDVGTMQCKWAIMNQVGVEESFNSSKCKGCHSLALI